MNNLLTGQAIYSGINVAALGIQFATVEAGNYYIGGGFGSLPEEEVTIEKPFGLATTPFTNEQLRKVLAQLKADSESAPRNTLLMGELPGGKMKLLARGTEEAITSMPLNDAETAVKRSVTLADLRNLESGMTVYDAQNAVLTDAVQRGPVVLQENYHLIENEEHRAQFMGERRPATMISWNESTALALLLQLRLLDEIEWEVAARGKEKREYPSFNGQLRDASGKNLGHFGESAVADVGSYPPIQIGGVDVFGLLGNVWEWTESLYEADSAIRVLRGGSWLIFYGPELLRAAFRNGFEPEDRYYHVGFRLAPPQDS